MAPELDLDYSSASLEMEAYEATRIVYSRVQSLDPENVSKIMGFLLLQDQGEHQILCLAAGSDSLLQSAVANARMQLGLIKPLHFSELNNNNNNVDSKRRCFSREKELLISQQLASLKLQQPPMASSGYYVSCNNSSSRDSSFSGGVFPNDHFYPETFAFLNSSKIKAEKSGGCWQLLDELKPCVYYSRGSCKHGSSCRFVHNSCSSSSGPSSPDNNNNNSNSNGNGNGKGNGNPIEQPHDVESVAECGSLEKLEAELQELLSSRKLPVSIAALPQLYYERFGRPLQAEGYLTESQRHGKSGYNLTRLLSKLRDTITLIDRPHGQHAIVLAEDAHKFATPAGEQYDLNGVNPSSRQIYLTFPAESAFSEDDVNIHFRAYGPVQDVRIPYQQRRMFGFVTFVYPETVKIVLSEGNPHYICGARVLVKPYRERGKHGSSDMNVRKHLEKSDSFKYMEITSAVKDHNLSSFQDPEEHGNWNSVGSLNRISSPTGFLKEHRGSEGNNSFGMLFNGLDDRLKTNSRSERMSKFPSWSSVARSGLSLPDEQDLPRTSSQQTES